MYVDFLIVGQGLAGSSLAIRLLKLGKTVLILDDPSKKAASRVAAGLYNPIVFRRITLGWRAEDCLAEAALFYTEQERILNDSFYHPDGFYRVHSTQFEVDSWKKLSLEKPFDAFLNEQKSAEERNFLNQPFGGARIEKAGWVNCSVFLNRLRENWLASGNLMDQQMNYDEIKIHADGIDYRGIRAGKLLFCEGHFADKNPWFGDLPYAPAKGEVLIIHSPQLVNELVNAGIYVVPIGNDLFRIGATYSWDQPNSDTTQEAREELTQKLKSLLTVPFQIIGQEAGIRPSVQDRRPLAGLHADFPNLGIFNGFGTKGVLLAPLLSKEFADFLVNNAPFSTEYDISRYRNRPVKS
jgi:glycine/D-amino acid oxidase-like deaminating enzyme